MFRLILLSFLVAAPAASQEVLIYAHGSGATAVDSMVTHADVIDIIAPQAFRVDTLGVVRGQVDPRLLEEARRLDIQVIPLIVNPGFNQELMHTVLDSPAARQTAVDSMVAIGTRHGFDGWQFDFENFHVSYRDKMTAFYAETAEALHAAGMSLSIAVVPTDGITGESPFARYMADNWRNMFDMAAMDSIGDFISLMTYAQHGGATAPGPIAGLAWTDRMLEFALVQGVDPARISLGMPFYSGHWEAHHSERTGLRPVGREVPYRRVHELLEAGGTTPQWLPDVGASLAYWEQEGTYQWLFIEDGQALRAKLEAFRPELRGISIWVMGAEAPGVWDEIRRWKTRTPDLHAQDHQHQHTEAADAAAPVHDSALLEAILEDVRLGWENGDGTPFYQHFLDWDGARYFEGGGQNEGLEGLVINHVEPEAELGLQLGFSNIQTHFEGAFAWAVVDTEIKLTTSDGRDIHNTGHGTYLFRWVDDAWKVVHTQSASRPIRR
ncbi:MAG: hypothetical protein HKN29_01990 [Rhodothermales bacterium]|nr:hypothetical protein [Rhodothermales bacterium]